MNELFLTDPLTIFSDGSVPVESANDDDWHSPVHIRVPLYKQPPLLYNPKLSANSLQNTTNYPSMDDCILSLVNHLTADFKPPHISFTGRHIICDAVKYLFVDKLFPRLRYLANCRTERQWKTICEGGRIQNMCKSKRDMKFQNILGSIYYQDELAEKKINEALYAAQQKNNETTGGDNSPCSRTEATGDIAPEDIAGSLQQALDHVVVPPKKHKNSATLQEREHQRYFKTREEAEIVKKCTRCQISLADAEALITILSARNAHSDMSTSNPCQFLSAATSVLILETIRRESLVTKSAAFNSFTTTVPGAQMTSQSPPSMQPNYMWQSPLQSRPY
eukprot:GHVL01009172.1.p1 GENE.GHVL01009172.1~~GHVL01009172.1.p1  ORF type:complete len:335 (+),score=66.52 GHVL01009172.1:1434-2438(+)